MLAFNSSPSEITFTVYDADEPQAPVFDGEMERMGTENTAFHFTDSRLNRTTNFCFFSANYNDAVRFMIHWLEKQKTFCGIKTVRFITDITGEKTALENAPAASGNRLKSKALNSTQYLTEKIKLKELIQQHWPGLKQIVCVGATFTGFPALSFEGNIHRSEAQDAPR